MLATQIAERIRMAIEPKRYSLPPEADQYARRHKSASGQQEFRWITIGGDNDGEHKHAGGTHVQIKSSTGEIVAGPDALTGKKVGELGKPEQKKPEAPARKSGYFKGDRIEYTGKMVDGFHEFEYMEGHKKGETGVTATAPDGSHPRDGKFQEEWKQQQEEFGRLHKKPEQPSSEAEKTDKPSDRIDKLNERTGATPQTAILDHLKTGKHTSLTELRDAIGDSPELMEHLQQLADDDRISMHNPRAGEPGLWMTPEQVKRHGESPEALAGVAGESFADSVNNSQPEEKLPDLSEGDSIPQATDEPRKEASKLFQNEYDSEYAFARKSSIPNLGEDIQHSARHKRNAWRGLAQAEADGTAENLVTRDSLLKLEPHDLIERAEENPLTALAMHFAMRTIPAKPGYKGRGPMLSRELISTRCTGDSRASPASRQRLSQTL